MIPKTEYQIIFDVELNEGNRWHGVKGAIEEAQSMLMPEVVFESRVIVNKKLTAFLQGKPYEFTCILDNTGLEPKQDGVTKIILI